MGIISATLPSCVISAPHGIIIPSCKLTKTKKVFGEPLREKHIPKGARFDGSLGSGLSSRRVCVDSDRFTAYMRQEASNGRLKVQTKVPRRTRPAIQPKNRE
jgi:hypothetical protein